MSGGRLEPAWHNARGVAADDGPPVPVWHKATPRPGGDLQTKATMVSDFRAEPVRPEAILRSMLRSTTSHRPRLVLVTGGAGFIGSNLVRALEARGDRVRVIDSGEVAGYDHLAGTAADLVNADIGDITPAAVAGADAVVHLAARAGIAASLADPLGDLRINAGGTLAVLEAARAQAVPRFLFASSGAAVGHAELPLSERSLPRPLSPYGAGKLAAEAYLHAYHASYGMATLSLRLANSYGPFSAHKSSVVARFMRNLVDGRPLVIRGDGHQTRDLVHVDDVVTAMLAALDAPLERLAGGVIHIGSGRETAIVELAERLFAVAGRRVPIENVQATAGDVAQSVSDLTAAREMLGYDPTVDLDSGLASTLTWYEQAVRARS